MWPMATTANEVLAADGAAVMLLQLWERRGGWLAIGLLIDSTLIDKS